MHHYCISMECSTISQIFQSSEHPPPWWGFPVSTKLMFIYLNSRGHNLIIGLFNFVFPIFIFATLTHPSVPGNISNTLPSSHFPYGVSGSTTNTKSFSFMSSCSVCHFFQDPIIGNRSLIHLFQKWHTISWILLHPFFRWKSSLSTESSANSPLIVLCKKWFGVIGISASGFAPW